VRSLSSNVHVIAVQFTRPFAYSSSTWVSSDSEDHTQRCAKDVRRFMPAAEGDAGNWSATADRGAQDKDRDVTVTTRSTRAPYQYVIKSADEPPHMKLTIPGLLNLFMCRPIFKRFCIFGLQAICNSCMLSSIIISHHLQLPWQLQTTLRR